MRVGFEDGDGFDEGPINSAVTTAVTQPATVSVPWSATMTVGEETGGSWTGFLGSALNFVATPFGSLSDSTTDTVDGTTHRVAGVTFDSSGTGTLTLYADPAFTGSVSLAYGADASLATTDATAGTEGTVDKYDWSPHDDPDWGKGDRVALAIVVARNVPATGAPAISGTPQVGEALTAETFGISDPNGKPDDAQGFDYQWQRSDDGNAWTDIAGATAPNYYPSDADVDKHIHVQVSFEDNDGFDEEPINSVGTVAGQAVYTATMTVDSSGLSFGYEPSNAGFPDATLTPDSFAYKGIQYEVDRLTAAGGEDLN